MIQILPMAPVPMDTFSAYLRIFVWTQERLEISDGERFRGHKSKVLPKRYFFIARCQHCPQISSTLCWGELAHAFIERALSVCHHRSGGCPGGEGEVVALPMLASSLSLSLCFVMRRNGKENTHFFLTYLWQDGSLP